MEVQSCEVLSVCVQVTPESVDMYMKPPRTTAASFCVRGIGWKKTSQRAIDGAAHPRHRALQTRGRQTDYAPQRPWTEGVAHTRLS